MTRSMTDSQAQWTRIRAGTDDAAADTKTLRIFRAAIVGGVDRTSAGTRARTKSTRPRQRRSRSCHPRLRRRPPARRRHRQHRRGRTADRTALRGVQEVATPCFAVFRRGVVRGGCYGLDALNNDHGSRLRAWS